MICLTLALLVLQAATPAQQKRVAWVPNPRASGGWVADPSHHLRAGTIDSLNSMATALERETSDEIAIVVVDSTSGLEPADFALALHRAWAVGKGTRDNGVVVLWVPGERALQVSVGYGLEGRLIDGRVGRIRDEIFFPAFKANEFDRGMLDGVGALVAAAREEGIPIDRIKQSAAERERERRRPPIAIIMSVIAGILAVLGLGTWASVIRYRSFHRCPKCGVRMKFIDDAAARRTFLDAGQQVEDRLGSVRRDFWVCPSCSARDSRTRGWRRAFEECPLCSYRTVQRTRGTIIAATTAHEGRDIVHHRCAHCDYSRDDTVVTPRVVESSGGGSSFGGGSSSRGSGGGSSGGSFGGGSAGGGGAGGRY